MGICQSPHSSSLLSNLKKDPLGKIRLS